MMNCVKTSLKESDLTERTHNDFMVAKGQVTPGDIILSPGGLGAFKARFFGSHFGISPEIWDRLNNLLIDGNPGYQKKLERIERRRIPIEIAREKEMEDRLPKDPGILRKQGYHLELIARQMICIGAAGRLDLLFRDTKKGFVAVELKNVKADQNTFGQICSYVG